MSLPRTTPSISHTPLSYPIIFSFQFPEHGFYGLQDRILLFRHDQLDSNILKLVTTAQEVTDKTLVEVKSAWTQQNQDSQEPGHTWAGPSERNLNSIQILANKLYLARSCDRAWLKANVYGVAWLSQPNKTQPGHTPDPTRPRLTRPSHTPNQAKLSMATFPITLRCATRRGAQPQ